MNGDEDRLELSDLSYKLTHAENVEIVHKMCRSVDLYDDDVCCIIRFALVTKNEGILKYLNSTVNHMFTRCCNDMLFKFNIHDIEFNKKDNILLRYFVLYCCDVNKDECLYCDSKYKDSYIISWMIKEGFTVRYLSDE